MHSLIVIKNVFFNLQRKYESYTSQYSPQHSSSRDEHYYGLAPTRVKKEAAEQLSQSGYNTKVSL